MNIMKSKKILKIIVSILLIIVILFLANLCRNFIIINKLYKMGSNFKFPNNYEITIKYKNSYEEGYMFENNDYAYYKDDIFCLKEEKTSIGEEGETTEIGYLRKNLRTGEINSLEKDENGNFIPKETEKDNNAEQIISEFVKFSLSDSDANETKLKVLINNMFNVITLDKGCYKIRCCNPKYLFIDKNTGLKKKIVYEEIVKGLPNEITITYLENTVTEKDIELPL